MLLYVIMRSFMFMLFVFCTVYGFFMHDTHVKDEKEEHREQSELIEMIERFFSLSKV